MTTGRAARASFRKELLVAVVLRSVRGGRKCQPDVGASAGCVGSVRLATVGFRYRLHDRKAEPAARALTSSPRS